MINIEKKMGNQITFDSTWKALARRDNPKKASKNFLDAIWKKIVNLKTWMMLCLGIHSLMVIAIKSAFHIGWKSYSLNIYESLGNRMMDLANPIAGVLFFIMLFLLNKRFTDRLNTGGDGPFFNSIYGWVLTISSLIVIVISCGMIAVYSVAAGGWFYGNYYYYYDVHSIYFINAIFAIVIAITWLALIIVIFIAWLIGFFLKGGQEGNVLLGENNNEEEMEEED